MEVHHFIKYTPPPTHASDCDSCPEDLSDEILEWKERMKYIHEDIDWLLRLPNETFWQQIISDKTFSSSYDSFWQFCPRPFDLQAIPNQCTRIQEELRKLFLLLFLRICGDTKLDGLTDQSHACLLYDNFLLDVPKILDVCCIYGSINGDTKQLISNTFQAVFQKQQGYWNDLSVAMETIFTTFSSIAERFCLLGIENETLPKQIANESNQEYSSNDLNDVLVYLYDTANSLYSLVSMCEFTSRALFEMGSLERVAAIIDKHLPRLKDLFGDNLSGKQRKYFKLTKKLLLQFCHAVVNTCFFNLSEQIVNDTKLREELLNTISTLLSDSRFIISYEKRYELSKDLRKIEKTANDDHAETLAFIQQVIRSLVPEDSAVEGEKGAVASITDGKINELIAQVKAMFPDEEDAFLKAAIVHFDGNPETVINHIIEDNFPPYLDDIRRPRPEVSSASIRFKGKEADGHLPGHYYMKSDRISKSEVEEIFASTSTSKDLLQYGQWRDDENMENGYLYDEYDDEYDDTYDSHNIGAMDADSGDELRDSVLRRKFVKPKVLQALEKQNLSDTDEGEVENSSDSDPENKADENPPADLGWNGTNASNRGRGWRRGRGNDRAQRRMEGEKERAGGNQERRGANERGRPPSRMRRGGPSAPRGRGGKKNHNQKSLALKKSGKGMTGF